MKLGICYMVFDGYELLEFAIKSIRKSVDYVSVTYQSVSYFGNKVDDELEPLLLSLKKQGLVDEILYYETDLSLEPKENELRLRNLGLSASRNVGCTHHISADVDEFYKTEQLDYVKNVLDRGNYDFSIVPFLCYYKDPRYLIHPPQDLVITLIHPVDNEYVRHVNYPDFPFHMETTRRFGRVGSYRVFSRDEFEVHHMSYVRRDIRKKFANSDNARFYNLKNFYKRFDTYELGERVVLLPDYLNRKTILVDNIFNIELGEKNDI